MSLPLGDWAFEAVGFASVSVTLHSSQGQAGSFPACWPSAGLAEGSRALYIPGCCGAGLTAGLLLHWGTPWAAWHLLHGLQPCWACSAVAHWPTQHVLSAIHVLLLQKLTSHCAEAPFWLCLRRKHGDGLKITKMLCDNKVGKIHTAQPLQSILQSLVPHLE